MSNAPARLLLVVPGGGFEEVEAADRLSIGRSPDCDLVLEGNDLSRVHAVIEREGDRRVLLDNGSRNGVEVNGQRAKRRELRPGDVILVGHHFLVFEPPESLDLDAVLARASSFSEARAARGSGVPALANRDEFAPATGVYDCEELMREIEAGALGAPSAAPERAGPDAAVQAIARWKRVLYLAQTAASVLFRQDEPDDVCKAAARAALDALGGDKALIMLRQPGGSGDLEVGALVAREECRGSLVTPAAMGLLLAENRAVAWSRFARPESGEDPLAEDAELLAEAGVCSFIGAPLTQGGDSFGFFSLESFDPERRYGVADLKALLVLGEHVALHLLRLW